MTDQQNPQAVLEDSAEYISVTLKIPGRQGEAQPWIVARARHAAAAEDQMRQLQHGGLFAQMGRAQAIMEAAYRQAKSTPLSAEDMQTAAVGQEVAHAEGNAQAAYAVGNGLGASAMSPQPGGADTRGTVHAAQAPAEQAPAPQEPVSQPHQARPEPSAMQQPMAPQPAAQAPQAMAPQSAGQTQLQQYQQQAPQQPQPGMAPQVGMAPQAAAQPAPQQQGMFGQQPAMPGAPMILGQPARFHSGSGARGPWQAFFDPRPKEQTDGLEDTDDPNHPGLAGGTHKFVRFIR